MVGVGQEALSTSTTTSTVTVKEETADLSADPAKIEAEPVASRAAAAQSAALLYILVFHVWLIDWGKKKIINISEKHIHKFLVKDLDSVNAAVECEFWLVEYSKLSQ